MEKWNGFTEDDIRKLKSEEVNEKEYHDTKGQIVKHQSGQLHSSVKKNVTRQKILHHQHLRNNDSKAATLEIPEAARLTVQKKSQEVKDHTSKLQAEDNLDSGHMSPSVSESPESPSAASTPETSPSRAVCLKIKEGGGYEVLCTEKNTNIALDEFQAKQKLMEEQNRQRKNMLAKALADRKKKTHEEVKRLQHIQEELQKLDVMLSNDVSVLRNEIEDASIDFMEAQKRYNKAEKEFLDAKLTLFHKLERKELLTEHLYKIIEQNELRKAQKLSELMNKLELSCEPVEAEQKNSPAILNLVSTCTLDEVTYAACNTLKTRKMSFTSSSAHDNMSEKNPEVTTDSIERSEETQESIAETS